jgi:OOP family OmpA-OmpF porin
MIAPAPKPVPVEKIVRLEGANFATGSAKLLKAADAKLNEVVNAAKQYPEANFVVSGHTDSRGKKASNQKLSEHRAAAVKAYLVAHGVAANRISTAGYADSKPAASNDTVKGRAENRRVEVKYAVKEVK